MPVYHTFVDKAKARAMGFDIDDPNCSLGWLGPAAFLTKFRGHEDAYAMFHPPQHGERPSAEYNRYDSDMAKYRKFLISGN